MKAELPNPATVNQAIDMYLAIAYAEPVGPTTTVKSMVSLLRSWAGPFFNAPVFVKSGDGESPRYTMRLGNARYPHMKLALEASPDGKKYLFKADTHDRHICPSPGTPEHEPFVALMRQNQEMAERIESVWMERGLPTFKSYLREDLLRRKGASAATTGK